MATNRQPLPRTTPAASLAMEKGRAITVEEWEAKTNLSADGIQTVNALRKACQEKPLPPKFQELEQEESPPSTPLARLKVPPRASPSPRPRTPAPPTSKGNHVVHWKHQIATPEQFHDWFAKLERSVLESQESHYRDHLEMVSEYLERCNHLLELVENAQKEVDSMLENWRSVEQSGESLKGDCARVLAEKDELLEKSEGISSRMNYFLELETATKMLNHPGDSIVSNPDFLLMTERLDICLDFLRDHRNYREADLYILRYQQCLTRAMTLIQISFVGNLKAMTSDIQKRIMDKDLSDTARNHLLYKKFSGLANTASPLLSEMERRVQARENDLDSLLAECQSLYLNSRKTLLVSKLVEDIKGLDPSRADLVELTRSGCGYLKQLCSNEFHLYRRFFNSGVEKLYAFLENLCDYLYDILRPRILHEQRLKTLCEVCTVLQALIILDAPQPNALDELPEDTADEEEEEDIELDFTEITIKDRRPFALRKLQVSHLLQLVLQDAQTRLVFRTQAVLQAEVRYYTPKAEDLNYPEKLLEAPKSSSYANGNGKSEVNGDAKTTPFSLSAASDQSTWYPTLPKTLQIISQLNDRIKPAILSDIAREAVILCCQSLTVASQNLAIKNGGNSVFDAQLFLVRHLMLLKEMTSSLDFELSEKPPDGFSVIETLASWFKGTSIFGTAGFFGTFGGSNGGGNLVDARMEVDKELRKACEAIIDHCSQAATKPIHDFLAQCALIVDLPAKPKGASRTNGVNRTRGLLVKHEFAKPENLLKTYGAFRETCEREVTWWIKHLKLYLESDKMVTILISPTQAQIAEEYASFRDIVQLEYSTSVAQEVMSLTELWTFLKDICH